MIEGILSKASLYDGEIKDVSSFRKHDIPKAMKTLKDNGLDEYGYENMENSDGNKLPNKVYFVPLYEQALRHQVADKFQYRNTGTLDSRTHQPRSGRSKNGGLKSGEMEKDSFVAHGASSVIIDRLMKSSDEFRIIICHTCGTILNYKYCTVCNKSDPVVVLIPYVLKVLVRLLSSIGIDIRMNTEKVKAIKD